MYVEGRRPVQTRGGRGASSEAAEGTKAPHCMRGMQYSCMLVCLCVSVGGHESRKGKLYRGRGVQLMVMTGHCRARGTQYDRTLRYPCSPLPAFASNLLWFRTPRRSRCILRRSLGGMPWLSICAVDGWKTCGGPGEDLRRSCFSVLCMRCSGLAGSAMEPAA